MPSLFLSLFLARIGFLRSSKDGFRANSLLDDYFTVQSRNSKELKSWSVVAPVEGPAGREEKISVFSGKIEGIIYDRFGDFEGFILETFDGRNCRFESREIRILKIVRYAWTERMVTKVLVEPGNPHKPMSVILNAPPSLNPESKDIHRIIN